MDTPEGTILTHRLSRRAVLRGGGFAAGGFGLFLIGCTSDDDPTPAPVATEGPAADPTEEPTAASTEEPTAEATEEATAEPTEEPTAEPTEEPAAGGSPSKVIVQSVSLTGDEGTVVLRNLSDATVTMDGWFICQRPSYWAIPSTTLEPGGEVTLHAGAGTDDAANVFADGGFGGLNGSQGEIGLYNSASFGSSDAIVSFVAWNGSTGRATEARGAGIWGADTVEATEGDTIVFVGPSEDASGYALQ